MVRRSIDGRSPGTSFRAASSRPSSQIIHDELMLDGNARLNLATFVTTWMEPQAEKLMAECFDKNMIDKDEYPQTAELEMRCVNILEPPLARTRRRRGDGLLDDRLERGGDARRARAQAPLAAAAQARGQAGRQAEPRDGDQRPGLLGEVRQLLGRRDAARADGGRPLPPLGAEEAVKLCDENTIGVVAILGSTFDGSYEPVQEICAALDDLQARTGIDVPVHVDGASGAFVAPFLDPDLVWDFRLPRVASINASGHKYGLVYPGVGWIVWRDADALPEDLIFWVNYLGDNMPTFALNFSRPGAQVVAQYYNFLRLGFDGYRKVQGYARDVATRLSARIAELGPFELITKGDELPVFAFTAAGRDRQLHRLRRLERAARARLAGAGLHLPGEPRRTSRRSASSSSAASPTTWPTCSSTTSNAQLPRLEKQAAPVHDADDGDLPPLSCTGRSTRRTPRRGASRPGERLPPRRHRDRRGGGARARGVRVRRRPFPPGARLPRRPPARAGPSETTRRSSSAPTSRGTRMRRSTRRSSTTSSSAGSCTTASPSRCRSSCAATSGCGCAFAFVGGAGRDHGRATMPPIVVPLKREFVARPGHVGPAGRRLRRHPLLALLGRGEVEAGRGRPCARRSPGRPPLE